MTRRRGKSQRGNSLVEFALSSSVLILSYTGAFQFGFGFYRYNVLESAVSNGAKYASTRTYRCLAGSTDITKVKTSIQNVVVYGTPSPGSDSTSVIPGLQAANISVEYALNAQQLPQSVTVRVQSFTIDAVFKTITLTNKPYAAFPFVGRYAPEESEP
jgi:Flp pilus assembly protein TadG